MLSCAGAGGGQFFGLGQYFFELSDQMWVHGDAGFLTHDVEGLFRGHCLAVRAGGGQGVPDIGNLDDPSQQRYFRSDQAVRIARAVIMLVMTAYRR